MAGPSEMEQSSMGKYVADAAMVSLDASHLEEHEA